MTTIGRNHLYRCRRFESFKNADELFICHRVLSYPFYNILYAILRALSRNFFVLMIKIFIAALLITKSKGRWNFGLFIRRQGLTWTNHCLANALYSLCGKFFLSKISYFSGGNPTIFPLVCRLGVVKYYFALSLRWSLLPHSKGRLSLSELSCYVDICYHLN